MSTPPTKAAPFLYLIGYPGSGKQTVARELLTLLSDARVLDNHLLINLTRAVFKQGTPEYEELRGGIRREMLDAIVRSETARHTTYIFTGAHVESNPVCIPITRDIATAAAARGSQLVSVILHCDIEENIKRGTNSTRAGKLTNPDTIRKIIESGPVYSFEGRGFSGVTEVRLDTTGKEPREVAEIIAELVKNASKE